MMQENQLNLAHYLTWGCDNSPPLNRISSRDSEVCGRKVGYSALRRSSLSHWASLSLHFQKLNLLTTSDTLCGIKNTNRVFSIRKVILEIKRFMVDFADGVLEATPEL